MEREDVSITFTDPGHAGDKRKRSQPCFCAESLEAVLDNILFVDSCRSYLTTYLLTCFGSLAGMPICALSLSCEVNQGLLSMSSIHENPSFAKSRAALGFLGPLARARVLELWSDDDKPCSPQGRVACHDQKAANRPYVSTVYRFGDLRKVYHTLVRHSNVEYLQQSKCLKD